MFIYYMEQNIVIDTPIIDLIQKTNTQFITKSKNTSLGTCAYNNLLLYNFFYLLTKKNVDSIVIGIKKGGGRKKSKRYHKKSNRKTRRNKVGGSHVNLAYVALFAIVFLYMSGNVASVLNVTHHSIIQDLRQSLVVSDIFRNKYGTCAANTMLFLKIIGLETFEDLSIQIMKQKRGLNIQEMEEYLSKNIKTNVVWDWLDMPSPGSIRSYRSLYNSQLESWKASSPQSNRYFMAMEFISDLKKRMIVLRDKIYGVGSTNSIVTMAGIPFHVASGAIHAVTLWLTSDNKLTLIDPQKLFFSDFVIVFTDDNLSSLGAKDIKGWSLTDYLVDNADFNSKTYALLTSMHSQFVDVYEKNKLEISNPQLTNVISNLRFIEKQMENENENENVNKDQVEL